MRNVKAVDEHEMPARVLPAQETVKGINAAAEKLSDLSFRWRQFGKPFRCYLGC
jgi:hypothetical protein